MEQRRRPQILFLDAYDSFSNNIVSLLTTLLQVDVHVLPIDAPLSSPALRQELAHYDAVVCGPGPGSPCCPADIGLMKDIWETGGSGPEASGPRGGAHSTIPALGICLGFQSLVAAHGGRIRRLRSGGLHGMVREVAHVGGGGGGGGGGTHGRPAVKAAELAAGIFHAIPPFRATLYHSLGADIGQDDIPAELWSTTASRWQPSTQCPDLVPLAWVEEQPHQQHQQQHQQSGASRAQASEPERILMAVRHRTLPFWGLQYHPESVCTDVHSRQVLANWLREALRWNETHGRVASARNPQGRNKNDHVLARQATRPSLLSLRPSILGHEEAAANGTSGVNGSNGSTHHHPHWKTYALGRCVASRSIPLPAHVQVPDIVEALEGAAGYASPTEEPEHIILDSSTASVASEGDAVDTDATRGRYSIIALNVDQSLRIAYRTGSSSVTIRVPKEETVCLEQIPLQETQSIWQFLAEFHNARRLPETQQPPFHIPFFGGFMGYITYEQGLGDIGVALPQSKHGRGHERPDLCFAWVTQSIVVDHNTGQLYVQHLGADDNVWVADIVERLQASSQWKKGIAFSGSEGTNGRIPTRSDDCTPTPCTNGSAKHQPGPRISIRTPVASEYEEKVRACQECIAAGDSYELCLTDQTTIRVSSGSGCASSLPPSWNYYRALRTRNPAPFASYIRLGGATLVSSSPERFLAYTVRNGQTVCSMRPMKGTVRRSAQVSTLAQAEKMLRVPKEEAENLMIVDLVRHDLYSVCGAGRVDVPRLLQVEPYGHVFQMVSVVEGRLQQAPNEEDASAPGRRTHTGLDVLAASLPPGSMTGAPKKRSCEILCQIEQSHERSLYSGVVGYMCVTGRGDWSVTIRSLFRWDDETVARSEEGDAGGEERQEVWHIGAGGAVTIQSTAEGERDEMFAKLAGPLGIFSQDR